MIGKTNERGITLMAVGDVLVNRDDPDSAFALALPALRRADIVFGNCEGVYSERRGEYPPPGHFGAIPSTPRNIAALKTAGFTVMSFANNTCLGSGYETFFDTLDGLRSHEISPVGAGRNIVEARAPVIVERRGVRVAFLAYCSVLPFGFAAGASKPGCAPMTAHALYEELDPTPPGSRGRILTFANRRELKALRQDVETARASADVVVVSVHWGTNNDPYSLADYEEDIGHAAVDAGADLVLGHNQHMLQAVEKYQGKFIFHGLGNFVLDFWDVEKLLSPALVRQLKEMWGEYTIYPREGYPSYPWSAVARRTMIAAFEIEDRTIARASFRPCLINSQGQPALLPSGSKEHEGVVEFVAEANRRAGFETRFTAAEDEVVVS